MGNSSGKSSDDINFMYFVQKQENKKIKSYLDAKLNDSSSKLDLNTPLNKMGDTLLHYCVYKENTELIKYLLDKGADATIKNSRGLTPIEIAESIKNKNIKELILQHGRQMQS